MTIKRIGLLSLLVLAALASYLLFSQRTSNANPPSYDTIIGMSQAEASNYAKERNIPFRVYIEDGEGLMVTLDLVPGRINAEVENDVIVDYMVE